MDRSNSRALGSRESLALALALILLALLRAIATPIWPDDWDGISFVLSIHNFDLTKFTPHAPGYPVYVALLKTSALFTSDAIRASNMVAILSGVIATGVSYVAALRVFDRRRAIAIALALSITPLVWRTGTAIGSEAPAFMFVAITLLGLTVDGMFGALLVGVGIGLGLGVRLSWAPIFVALYFLSNHKTRGRLRTIAFAAIATLAWIVPMMIVVGPRALIALMRTQASGHMTRWGGTEITDPGWSRVVNFLRDIFVDGLGADRDLLGVAIAIVLAWLFFEGVMKWRKSGWIGIRAAAIAIVPYAIWIGLAQNLREAPRHTLPIVSAIAFALALAALTSSRARIAGTILVVLITIRTATDARDRIEFPPVGAELTLRLARLPLTTHDAVFGGRSARFFELTPNVARATVVETLGDATLALGRMPELPSRVFVTSELEGVNARDRSLTQFSSYCRPPRTTRRAPCLTTYEWLPRF